MNDKKINPEGMNSEDLSEDSILQNSAYNGKETVISDEGANATSE